MWKSMSLLLAILILSPAVQAQRIVLDSPVIDAKENFKQGKKNFVGMQWEGELLLPGVAQERQMEVRANYPIVVINKGWGKPGDTDYVPGKEYHVKRYANRYNLMMEKLIRADKLEKARRYRY